VGGHGDPPLPAGLMGGHGDPPLPAGPMGGHGDPPLPGVRNDYAPIFLWLVSGYAV